MRTPLEIAINKIKEALDEQKEVWGDKPKDDKLLMSVLLHKAGFIGTAILNEDEEDLEEALVHTAAFLLGVIEQRL